MANDENPLITLRPSRHPLAKALFRFVQVMDEDAPRGEALDLKGDDAQYLADMTNAIADVWQALRRLPTSG